MFGAAALIQDGVLGRVESYVSKCDLVSWTNPNAYVKALIDSKSNVQFLSHSSSNRA